MNAACHDGVAVHYSVSLAADVTFHGTVQLCLCMTCYCFVESHLLRQVSVMQPQRLPHAPVTCLKHAVPVKQAAHQFLSVQYWVVWIGWNCTSSTA
jgi:hypothetical protein